MDDNMDDNITYMYYSTRKKKHTEAKKSSDF